MLLAMEYLLNKLENNQKLPITEMRKAIDTGKTQKKRSSQSSRLNEPETALARAEAALEPREKTAPARSIARGAQPSKPMRAPKVSRVRTEQEQTEQETPKEAVMTQKRTTNTPDSTPAADSPVMENDAPAAENWLDELLMNLIEREKVGYGEPLQAAQQPDCDNGDIDLNSVESDGAEKEEPAGESEYDSAAVEEEPR